MDIIFAADTIGGDSRGYADVNYALVLRLTCRLVCMIVDTVQDRATLKTLCPVVAVAAVAAAEEVVVEEEEEEEDVIVVVVAEAVAVEDGEAATGEEEAEEGVVGVETAAIGIAGAVIGVATVILAGLSKMSTDEKSVRAMTIGMITEEGMAVLLHPHHLEVLQDIIPVLRPRRATISLLRTLRRPTW